MIKILYFYLNCFSLSVSEPFIFIFQETGYAGSNYNNNERGLSLQF